MKNVKFIPVDRILARLSRELRNTEFNETDVIEWIGEAMEFLSAPNIHEESVAFLTVQNYEVDLPIGFHAVIQVAKNKNWTSYNRCVDPCNVLEKVSTDSSSCPTITDCYGNPLSGTEANLDANFNLAWEYAPWTNCGYYTDHYEPVRLSNHTFFNTLVCQETSKSVYQSSTEEYTIVGTTEKKLRFSFKDGSIALSYLKNRLDPVTGYPLVPDQISFITAVNYYVKWKLAEWYAWNGRQGFDGLAADNERKWLKYVSQAKAWAKMPRSIDDYQDLLEETHYLIPRHRKYYGFFGNLGREESRPFNLSSRNNWRKLDCYSTYVSGCQSTTDSTDGCCKAVNSSGTVFDIQELSQSEIDALTPTELMIVYNTTTRQFQAWNGFQWVNLDMDQLQTVTDYRTSIDGGYVYSGYLLNGVPTITRCMSGSPEQYAQGVTNLAIDWPNRTSLTYI